MVFSGDDFGKQALAQVIDRKIGQVFLIGNDPEHRNADFFDLGKVGLFEVIHVLHFVNNHAFKVNAGHINMFLYVGNVIKDGILIPADNDHQVPADIACQRQRIKIYGNAVGQVPAAFNKQDVFSLPHIGGKLGDLLLRDFLVIHIAQL